jgi:hypothetical protein
MDGRQLALAESASSSSQSRSKRKRSRKNKRSSSVPVRGPDFSELEQSFFAAAPPDDPGPTVEPERFDDLVALASPRPQPFGALLRAVATAGLALRRFFLALGSARRSRSGSPR